MSGWLSLIKSLWSPTSHTISGSDTCGASITPTPRVQPDLKRKSRFSSALVIPSIERDDSQSAPTTRSRKRRKLSQRNGARPAHRSNEASADEAYESNFPTRFDGKTEATSRRTDRSLSSDGHITGFPHCDDSDVERVDYSGVHDHDMESQPDSMSEDSPAEEAACSQSPESGEEICVGGADMARPSPCRDIKMEPPDTPPLEPILFNLSLNTPKQSAAFGSASTPRKSNPAWREAQQQQWSSPAWTTAERLRREAEIATHTTGWRAEDARLYRELDLRSLQPSLPSLWRSDFRGWPKGLFTPHTDYAFVKSRSLGDPETNSDFHGVRALKRLHDLGLHVRDRVALEQPPERIIASEMEHFMRWTLDDAGIQGKRPYLPLLAIHSAPIASDTKTAQAQLVAKMAKLQRKWDAALEDHADAVSPPLYGLLAMHTLAIVVAPVSVDALHGVEPSGLACGEPIRVLGLYDFSCRAQDLWNTLALAMVAVHSRDVLLEALHGRALKGIDVDVDAGDPDA